MLHYDTFGSPQNDPLLLLHGFSGHGGDWAPFLQILADKFHVLVPDLPGHGRSTEIGESWTHARAATEVLEVLEHHNIRRCAAIGASSGGNTLLHMATRRPECLSSMILVSATSHFPEETKAIMDTINADSMSAEEWARAREVHVGGDDQIRAFWEQGQVMKDSDDMSFSAADLRKIQAPTLLIGGDRDPFYPVSIATGLYDAIPDSFLWVLPNAAHVPIFDPTHHEAFLSAAMRFCEPDGAIDF